MKSLKLRDVKAIFFDYGGTLDAPGIAWKEHFWPIYVEQGKKAGVQFRYEEFVKAFYRSDDSLVDEGNPDLDLTNIVHEQVRRVLEGLGVKNTGLVKAIASEFIASSKRSINLALPVLGELKKHFFLGIISNNYGNLEAICLETGLHEVMDVMVDSRVVGAVKPDPHIFNEALHALGVKADEAVMVGDSFPRDIKGAVALGMGAAWLVPENRRAEAETKIVRDLPKSAVQVICSVQEIKGLV